MAHPKGRNHKTFTIKGIICTHTKQKDKSAYEFDENAKRKGKGHENFFFLSTTTKFEENSIKQIIKIGNRVISIIGNWEYNH